MSEFRLPSPSRRGEEEEAAATAFTSAEGVVFVDVGAKKIDANVVRDGVPITALFTNQTVFDEIFAGVPRFTTKVVSQSVKAGTPVAVGATVDLVFAFVADFPIKLIDGVHFALGDRTFRQINDDFLEQNPELVRVLARTPTPELLTDRDEQILLQAFEEAGVEITQEPGETLAAGFQALKAGLAFRP